MVLSPHEAVDSLGQPFILSILVGVNGVLPDGCSHLSSEFLCPCKVCKYQRSLKNIVEALRENVFCVRREIHKILQCGKELYLM
jgi:hypothetical protein